tara:strand:- start:520 stop:798 length:279 start_codon:yes stop_codon:yes gene_type:complete
MYWFGRGLGVYAYHNIVRVRVEKDMVAYFGERHWPTVQKKLGMISPYNIAEYWKNDQMIADQLLTEKCGDERGERFWIMPYDELYATLENSK